MNNGFCRAGYQFIKFSLVFFLSVVGADDQFSEQTLRVGFYSRAFPDFSVEDIEISVKLLAEEIGKNVNLHTTVSVYEDINAMRDAFEQGKINFVAASSLNLATEFNNELLVDGFRLQISSNNPDSLLVMTRKNEGLDDIKTLSGKKLGLVEYDPVADLYIDFLSKAAFDNRSYKKVFREMPREKKAHQIILKLFFGQVDVICVYHNAYIRAAELNPQLSSKLQIIKQLDGIPQGAGFFHKNTPADFREKVIAEALKLDKHARGEQLLQLFKSDKAIRSTLTDLVATKKLYEEYQKLNNRK